MPNYIGMKLTASAGKKSNASGILIEMNTPSDQKHEFVVCVNNKGYPASLELHKIYQVLTDKDAASDGDMRVIDESGEDYLYPATYFSPISLPAAVQESLLKVS